LETEMTVRYALHHIGADLGEAIDVQASTDGHAPVSVVGIVPSNERKLEVLAALNGLPHVIVQLQTEEEAAQAMMLEPTPVTRTEALVVTPHSHFDKELLEHFGDPAAVEQFSKEAISVSKRLMAHAWALRHLEDRYGVPGTRNESTMNLSSLQSLLTIRRDHYHSMYEAASELATLLQPLLQSIVETAPEPGQKVPIFDSAQQVQRLTLDLLSGSGSQDGNEPEEFTKAAHDLLVALRGLEQTLEETR
jgi:hypothetical protein